jgi:hypothetical protein
METPQAVEKVTERLRVGGILKILVPAMLAANLIFGLKFSYTILTIAGVSILPFVLPKLSFLAKGLIPSAGVVGLIAAWLAICMGLEFMRVDLKIDILTAIAETGDMAWTDAMHPGGYVQPTNHYVFTPKYALYYAVWFPGVVLMLVWSLAKEVAKKAGPPILAGVAAGATAAYVNRKMSPLRKM